MNRQYDVLIAGAGIAGLTAAIALQQAGHTVRVFERQPDVQAVGAGLILWSNAFAAFRSLGLADEILGIGNPLSKLAILDQYGATLSATDAQKISDRVGSPTVAVSRKDLIPLLTSRLGTSAIQINRRLVKFDSTAGKVVAHLDDGSSQTGDLLLGADGIWSTVRAQIHGKAPARYSGYTAWRGLVNDPSLLTSLSDQSTESWGSGIRFGWVPLSAGGIYWFAVKNAPEAQEPNPAGHRPELLDLFGNWHSPIPETIEATPESQIVRHDIYDRPPVSWWGIGPVTLAGDAAHPMTPNTGQGAAQAIEDAVILADCLSRYQSIDGALRAYEQTRIPRTAMITQLSRRIGVAAQLSNPVSVRARNLIARVIPDSVGIRQILSIVNWQPPVTRKAST
jgi:2-polyprenyl-6-methoxyphenol hydroxylase-like FAD-dependent oxidoreductase